MTDKVRENRARRLARRLGYKLEKGRGYVANYYGRPYSLITADQSIHNSCNQLVYDDNTLADIELCLIKEAAAQRAMA